MLLTCILLGRRATRTVCKYSTLLLDYQGYHFYLQCIFGQFLLSVIDVFYKIELSYLLNYYNLQLLPLTWLVCRATTDPFGFPIFILTFFLSSRR